MSKRKNIVEWYYEMTPRQRAKFAVACDITPRHMSEKIMKREVKPSHKNMVSMASESGYPYRDILLFFYE